MFRAYRSFFFKGLQGLALFLGVLGLWGFCGRKGVEFLRAEWFAFWVRVVEHN